MSLEPAEVVCNRIPAHPNDGGDSFARRYRYGIYTAWWHPECITLLGDGTRRDTRARRGGMSSVSNPPQEQPLAFERRLLAIMSGDVAGYSRLMSDDDVATEDLDGLP
jgi:hypothetical protein